MEALPTGETRAASVVRLATLVRQHALTPGAAIDQLSNIIANRNSARDYLTAVRLMLDGETYKRRLNFGDTKDIISEIAQRHGKATASVAISAVRKHVAYYQAVGGNGQPGLAAYCDLWEKTHPTYDDFEAQVRASLALTGNARQKLLPGNGHKPSVGVVQSTYFRRCPHVVAHVLQRASGICESCNKPAPFNRRSDGSPYLEVHHRITLADGGDDTIENATALCPNCHREHHFGAEQASLSSTS